MPLDTPKRGQADPVLALIGNTPMVEVSRLIHPDMLVEIEAEAIITDPIAAGGNES